MIILFALFNSAIAVSIACMNASARFLYGMSRARALPHGLTKLHPVHGTPTNAMSTIAKVTKAPRMRTLFLKVLCWLA